MGSLHYSVGQPTQGSRGQVTVQCRLHVKSPTSGAHCAPQSVLRPLPAGGSSAPAHTHGGSKTLASSTWPRCWLRAKAHPTPLLPRAAQEPRVQGPHLPGAGRGRCGSPATSLTSAWRRQTGHLPTETTGVLRERRPWDWAANSISDPASRSLGWVPLMTLVLAASHN